MGKKYGWISNGKLNFILESFFKNEKHAGWKNIAEELILNGKCITTIEGSRLFGSGLSHFMTSKPSEQFLNCFEVTFDLDSFLQSKFYIDVKDEYIKKRFLEQLEINREIFEINYND